MKEKEVKQKELVYGKEQLLASKKYAERKDLLDAILEEDKEYSKKAVEEKIQQFMKGRVN